VTRTRTRCSRRRRAGRSAGGRRPRRRGALGAERVVTGAQRLGGLRVVDDPADLLADELGGGLVGGRVDDAVGVGGQHPDQVAAPGRLVLGAPLLGIDLQRRPRGRRHRDAEARLPRGPAVLRVAPLALGLRLRVQQGVVGRHAEVRGALEHCEVDRLVGDQRDRLDARRPGADDRDPPTGGSPWPSRAARCPRPRRPRWSPSTGRCGRGSAPTPRGCRGGPRRAGRSGRRRGGRSAGSQAASGTSPTTPTPARAPGRTSRSTPCSPRRSARRVSGSSTQVPPMSPPASSTTVSRPRPRKRWSM
jgi:hypothetical protein